MQVPHACTEPTHAQETEQQGEQDASKVPPQRRAGLLLTPDLQGVGDVIAALPEPKQTHPLDFVPKDDTDTCQLSIRQLLIVLQKAGFVASDDGRSHRGIPAQTAVEACLLACFPKQSAPVRPSFFSKALLHPLTGVALSQQERVAGPCALLRNQQNGTKVTSRIADIMRELHEALVHFVSAPHCADSLCKVEDRNKRHNASKCPKGEHYFADDALQSQQRHAWLDMHVAAHACCSGIILF